MATPSLAMIPSAYADSKVYSVLPNNGDGDFTFNRDSSATRVGQNGLIQTVGYFGNEEVTNGDFDTDSDWNKNPNWTISGGTANCDGTSNADINQGLSLFTPVLGKTYKVSIEITSISQGGIRVSVGGSATSYYTSTGIYTSYLTTISTDRVRIQPQNSAIGSVDNVSVQEVTGDQPRLNYDISNGVVQSCPSLLLEPASTNLIPYSSDFTQSNWLNIGSPTITPNYGISPDGNLNSARVQFASSSNSLYDAIPHSIGNTASIYVKGTSGETIQFGAGANVGVGQLFTLNGKWQRIEFQSTGTSVFCIGTYQSATARNIEVFGAQLEALSYPTSYIPTNGASQTRAAETCFGAGTASTFNDSEGVLYAEIAAISNSISTSVFSISDGSANNVLYIGFNATPNNITAQLVVGGAAQTNINHTVSDRTSFNKVAVLFKNNDHKMFINGVQVATDTSGSVPSANTFDRVNFNFGQGSFPFQGNCKDIRVYNEALTDAQLQTLTT